MGESALGFLLRSLREERGLSLRETAQLAELDHAYIYRLETGEKESPSEEALTKLIRALKPPKRETEILHFLAANATARPDLVAFVRDDPSITYSEFTALSGIAFRGPARPDYKTLLARIRKVLGAENGV